ncbi:hypothetical protein DH2020_043545 [Rehmannia glutinosa]|uniref:Ureidoglycolate hydrolase n=1 Tax=Rehmannia glutinosa TaxID=99300 RepID=A0ABR0UJA8_REHGL
MAPVISALFLSLYLLFNFVAISSQNDEYDQTTAKTMEAFSGYQIHESPFQGSFSSLSVDIESLQRQIDELSTFSDTPAPSVTRVLYSEKDVLARRYIKNLMGLSGLSVREDAVGNIFGRWVGSEPELAPVSTGSHIDAIPYSGKYDGVVGVLGAIEAINVLKRLGFKPKRSLEVIMFTSEEPTRFGISRLGSRLLAGSEELTELLKTTVDGHNISFSDAAKLAGYTNNEDLSSVLLKKEAILLSLNCISSKVPFWKRKQHQSVLSQPLLLRQASKLTLKVMEAMLELNDAGLAAAELALAVEKHVLESGSIDTVGTVGILELHPGAINSIPSKSHLEIEFKIVNQDPPALSEDSIIKASESACQELNLSYKKMISRAYHDSLFMARISPMGMIFIPCYKGYSHKPEEFAAPQDVANGVRVLALTLAKLSTS